jgi:hypothetical protein
LSDVLAIAQPAAYGRAVRLRRHVVDLAKAMELPPSWELEVSALLSQMGCVTLAPALVDRWYRHEPLSDEEQRLIDGIPTRTAELIAHIPRMTPVCDIILRQFESPRTLGIPVGAKLLAIARDFDGLIGSGERAEAALAIMKSQVQRYDESMLAVFHSLRESAPSLEIRRCDCATRARWSSLPTPVARCPAVARGQRVTKLIRTHRAGMEPDAASGIPVRVIIPNRLRRAVSTNTRNAASPLVDAARYHRGRVRTRRLRSVLTHADAILSSTPSSASDKVLAASSGTGGALIGQPLGILLPEAHQRRHATHAGSFTGADDRARTGRCWQRRRNGTEVLRVTISRMPARRTGARSPRARRRAAARHCPAGSALRESDDACSGSPGRPRCARLGYDA